MPKKRQKVNPTYTCTFNFGFASDSRRLRQAMWSERMRGMQCSVSGRRSLCYIVVMVQKSFCCGSPLVLLTGSGNSSTPSTGLFRDHFPRLPWLHSCNFQVSTVPHVPAEHENSPTIFTGFRSMQCTVRYIALSLTTLQCIQNFFSQTLFDFKRMVSHSISPKFSGKIPYVLSKPRICFLGSKDKTVLFWTGLSRSGKRTQKSEFRP